MDATAAITGNAVEAGAAITGPTLVARRHWEWSENYLRWAFLQDSMEGGDRYRYAIYGYEVGGLPVRNLVRHKREYPDPADPALAASPLYTDFNYGGPVVDGQGRAMQVPATLDDYEMRLRRTPVPTFVAEAVGRHLNRIFSREVERAGPDDLMGWWGDVDGCCTPIDRWMSETVGPLLLVLGQLDLMFDRPPAPGPIRTRADERQAGVDRCRASVVLPQNLPWWRLDARRRYAECLVREWHEDGRGKLVAFYRHWTALDSTLYDADGRAVAGGHVPHPYGCVPIVRVFNRRKVRCGNVGQSDYEATAERQREYYNRDSELILSDTTQAHPLLQGPEDYVEADGSIPIGPSWLLPKKKNTTGTSVSYEGFEAVDFPKDGAESIRRNLQALRDEVDRENCLAKPAGSAGTGAGTVGQSGISKGFDQADLNDLLSRRTRTLEAAEETFAALALAVVRGQPVADGPAAGADAVEVRYPTEFDLFSSDELARATTEIQGILSNAGAAPDTEWELIRRAVRLALPGLSDERYALLDDEIRLYLDGAKERHDQQVEADAAGLDHALTQLEAGSPVVTPTPKAKTPAPATPGA